MTVEFEASDHEQLPLWDFGWLDATRYAFRGKHPSGRPADILSDLLRSRVYRNSFAEAESFKHDPGPIHGPFWADRIDVSDYETLSFDELCDHVRGWLADPSFSSPPTDEQRKSVEALLGRIRETALHCSCLKLNLSDESHRHDTWFVHIIFHECVVFEHDAAWLLVVGYD